MATLRGAEVTVDAIVHKLRQGMPARVAQINIEKDDGIVITAPANEQYYTSGQGDSAVVAPFFVVVEGPSEFDGEGPHSFIIGGQYLVSIVEEDADRSTLGRKMQRQVRAIIETLWDDDPKEALAHPADPDAPNVAYDLVPVRTFPGPVFDDDTPSTWRGIYRVLFQAKQLEN